MAIDTKPRAADAHFDLDRDAVVVRLTTGVELTIPRRLLQGLTRAKTVDLASIKVVEAGDGLRWPSLGVDHNVSRILAGTFFTAKAIEQRRRAGSASTDAKAEASRKNGRKAAKKFASEKRVP